MREINYQELRERYSQQPVPKCRICGDEMTVQRICGRHITYGCTGATYDDKGCYYAEGRSIADDHYGLSRVTVIDVSDPEVLALLDERERNQQYIKSRDKENEDIALTVGKLRVELEGKDSKIANLTAERDALREGEMGDARHSNTRAAADIYFQLVEECEIPAGGSLVEYVDDMREKLEAAEKHIAELETKANQQTRISDKGLTKLIADADKMLGMRSPVIDSEWWTLLRQFLIELQDRRRNSISESGIRAETLNDLIRHIDRNLDIDAMKSPFELSSEIVDYVNRQLHKENS
ncbi:TPA: ead/Ea22-like family protein [Escherichia coli]|nr:ead/Ea22-like family protein [Escherichia coli]EZK18959.1 ead/Ea22-like family protein [Escherichia coli 1-176-05_S1_C2]EYD84470.1 ead/Ea22-like family protein [Escherichia coli 1-176-05_S1_C1]EZK10858.1 ead/Ea22-like family protein [Escherichia coli 1-176-05_S1_C3]KDU64297.1 ead/Ea22-like family protein [Escherichia coli 4-203-08_S1_C1]KEK92933.1 ead/Ea22-like family protein [Escherichia coli 4-203-08_S1_C2]